MQNKIHTAVFTQASLRRRKLLTASAALALSASGLPARAQSKTVLRISTPAVPDDWHAKMWTVFKDTLEKSAPGEFDVQINLNASLFKQGTEPAAMAEIGKDPAIRARLQTQGRVSMKSPKALTDQAAADEYQRLIVERGRLAQVHGLQST